VIYRGRRRSERSSAVKYRRAPDHPFPAGLHDKRLALLFRVDVLPATRIPSAINEIDVYRRPLSVVGARAPTDIDGDAESFGAHFGIV
jgi:hypothetical protein